MQVQYNIPVLTTIKLKEKIKNYTFPFKFKFKKRDPNQCPIDNVLDRDGYAEVSMVDLLAKVDQPTNIEFISAKERFDSLCTRFEPSQFPKYKKIQLGLLFSDEDIQRELIIPHATNIFATFDPARVQSIQAIKTPGKRKYTMVNGQHTASAIAAIISSGLMAGWEGVDWKKFPVTVGYIETHNRGKARETFALVNGDMSREISKFDRWKQHYLSVKLDHSDDPVYRHTWEIIELMKRYGIVPLPNGHDDIGQAGACTHLAAVETVAKDNLRKLEYIFMNHDLFWNNKPIDSTEYGLYGNILDITDAKNISRTTPEWDIFMNDLHAVIQQVFGTLRDLRSFAKSAYKNYRYHLFLDTNSSVPFNVELYVAYKVYKKLGGTFNIPTLTSMYVHKTEKDKVIDIINYLAKPKIEFINKFVSEKAKIVEIDINLPA